MNKILKKIREYIIFILGVIFASSMSALAACYTTIDSSNVTYDSSTVKTKIDTLLTTANTLNTKYNNKIKNQGSSNYIYFDGTKLIIPQNSPGSSPELTMTVGNNMGISLYYSASEGKSILSVKDFCSGQSTAAWGCGKLDLRANTVTINGVQIQNKIQVFSRSLGSVTIGSYGYKELSLFPSNVPSGLTLLTVKIATWSSNPSGMGFTAGLGTDNSTIVIYGQPNQVINGLELYYFYI